jgi:hypothetical protein
MPYNTYLCFQGQRPCNPPCLHVILSSYEHQVFWWILDEISKPHFFADGLHFIPWKQLATVMHTTIFSDNFSNGLFTEYPLMFIIICRQSRTCQCLVFTMTLAWPHVCLKLFLDLHVSLFIVTQANSINHDIPQWPPAEGEPMSGIHLV